jgi:hypothetical protein
MRAAILIVIAVVCSCATAHAQAWDSRYPVCQIVYGPTAQYNDCRYATLEQCRQLASGLPAQCVDNPYFAGTKPDPNRQRRRRTH